MGTEFHRDIDLLMKGAMKMTGKLICTLVFVLLFTLPLSAVMIHDPLVNSLENSNYGHCTLISAESDSISCSHAVTIIQPTAYATNLLSGNIINNQALWMKTLYYRSPFFTGDANNKQSRFPLFSSLSDIIPTSTMSFSWTDNISSDFSFGVNPGETADMIGALTLCETLIILIAAFYMRKSSPLRRRRSL